MSGCKIGAGSSLGQNVMIGPNVVLGKNVKVQNNVSIYTGVTCEDDVFIGPSVVFTNVRNPRSAVNRKNEFQKTLVKKGASIGANATIVCNTIIGDHAFIGAGSLITKDVPNYAIMIGNPGRHVGWMSENGQRLEFDNNGFATCSATGDPYMLKNNIVEKISG